MSPKNQTPEAKTETTYAHPEGGKPIPASLIVGTPCKARVIRCPGRKAVAKTTTVGSRALLKALRDLTQVEVRPASKPGYAVIRGTGAGGDPFEVSLQADPADPVVEGKLRAVLVARNPAYAAEAVRRSAAWANAVSAIKAPKTVKSDYHPDLKVDGSAVVASLTDGAVTLTAYTDGYEAPVLVAIDYTDKSERNEEVLAAAEAFAEATGEAPVAYWARKTALPATHERGGLALPGRTADFRGWSPNTAKATVAAEAAALEVAQEQVAGKA